MLWVGVGPVLLVQVPVMVVASIVGVLAVFGPAPVRGQLVDATGATGHRLRRRCTAAPGSACHACCSGSPEISGSTTCITCFRVCRTTACRPVTRPRPPSAASVTSLTLGEALSAPSFALWDEGLGRMVRFPENAMAPSFAAAGKASVGPAA